MGNITPSIQRTPNTEGWWARKRNGKVDWFFIHELDKEEGNHSFEIYLTATECFLPVEKFGSPSTRWFGPVSLPEGWKE